MFSRRLRTPAESLLAETRRRPEAVAECLEEFALPLFVVIVVRYCRTDTPRGA